METEYQAKSSAECTVHLIGHRAAPKNPFSDSDRRTTCLLQNSKAANGKQANDGSACKEEAEDKKRNRLHLWQLASCVVYIDIQ